MDLIRNLKTEVVHRPDCSSRGHDTGHWNWADGKTLIQVKDATLDYPWLHLCRTCMPGACRCAKCATTPAGWA
jgi:hypothetical protein